MKLAFHFSALLLLAAVVWLHLTAPPPPGQPSLAPTTQVMRREGYSMTAHGILPARQAWARFERAGCAEGVVAVLLPSVHRRSEITQAAAWLHFAGAEPVIVYDGAVISSPKDMQRRWLRLKALTYLRLRRPSAWDSSAMAYGTSGCAALPISRARMDATR